MPDSHRTSFRSAWIFGGALILSAVIISAGITNFNKAGDDIQVTGSAKRDVEADFAVWRLDISSRLPTQGEATRSTREGAEAVHAFLIANGFPDSVVTVRSPMSNAEEEWINDHPTGRIVAYRVSQQVEIRTTDVARIATMAGDPDNLLQSTRTSVVPSSPEYLINSLPEIRGSLTAEATRDAEKRAKEILEAVGAKPGRLKAVRVGVIQVSRRNSIEVSDYGMYDTRDRQKEVTAVVRVTFAVK